MPSPQIQVLFKQVEDEDQFYNAYDQVYKNFPPNSNSQTPNFTNQISSNINLQSKDKEKIVSEIVLNNKRDSDLSSKRLYHEPRKQKNFNYQFSNRTLNDNQTDNINSSPQYQPIDIFNQKDYQIHSPFQPIHKQNNKIDQRDFEEPATLNTMIPEYGSNNVNSRRNYRTLNPRHLSNLQQIDEVDSYRVSKPISRNAYLFNIKHSFSKKDKPIRYTTKTEMDIKLTQAEMGLTMMRNKNLNRGKKRSRLSQKHLVFKI